MKSYALLVLRKASIDCNAEIAKYNLIKDEFSEYHKTKYAELLKQAEDLLKGIVSIEFCEEKFTDKPECPECKVGLNKDGSCPSCEQDNADRIREAGK